jgi:hypothetical protein
MVMIGFSAYRPEFGSTEAVVVDYHDEQSITFSYAATAWASGCNCALYLVWRQVFTAAAGVVWLADERFPLRFVQNGDREGELLWRFSLLHLG